MKDNEGFWNVISSSRISSKFSVVSLSLQKTMITFLFSQESLKCDNSSRIERTKISEINEKN